MRTLLNSLRLGWSRLVSRRLILFGMVLVPVGFTWFFFDLMSEGLPLPVPVAVVDMDQSSMSRQVIRSLSSNQFVEIVSTAENYADALSQVRSGKTYGFFYIPRDFQKDALGGEGPTLTFYTNMSIFVPGTMSYKGLKTVAVTTKGALVQTTLLSAGVSDEQAKSMLQPVVIQEHPLGNPWLSYTIYLGNSFVPGVLILMVMLTTAYTICEEIKRGTSPEWLRVADGSIVVALFGKLAPQTLIFSVLGVAIQGVCYGMLDFPLNCSAWKMVAAMVMTVISSQAFALICCEIVPNLRLSLVLTALTGILSFSILGFSFPVDQMYGGVQIFSWIMPLRYYFLIYSDQALNGFALYYSRWWYAALCLFPLVSLIGLGRLKKRLLNPVYVP